MAGFYLFYKLLMSKETFHSFNRFSLLGLFLISISLPFCNIDFLQHPTAAEITVDMPAFEAEILPVEVSHVSAEKSGIDSLVKWCMIIYCSGILLFGIRNLWMLSRIIQITRSGKTEEIGRYLTEQSIIPKGRKVTLTVTDYPIAPFSWMNHIVLSHADLHENVHEILLHELAHIRRRHSIDLLLADLFILFQWFNPAAWLAKSELQTVHEFEADEEVIRSGVNAQEYQLLLIKKAVGSRLYSIANSLNHSNLKKRITMMQKKESKSWARAKFLLALPLAAVAVAAFARPEISRLSKEISIVKVSDFSANSENLSTGNDNKHSNNSLLLKGQVVDNLGKPIPGVSILIRNTTNGTLTDYNGMFQIPCDLNSVVILSYVGMQTYNLIVSDNTVEYLKKNPIKMKEEYQELDGVVVVGYGNKATQKPAAQSSSNQSEEVFIVVEEMPQYPGGVQELMKFLAKNIKYPVKAQEAKIQGRVIVQFIVNPDGSTSDFVVKRSVEASLDSEAIRVLKMMPKWQPGKQRGVNVAVKYTIPVTFHLQSSAPTAAPLPQTKQQSTTEEKQPLVIIDEKMSNLKEFKTLPPQDIISINILSNPEKAQPYYQKYNVQKQDYEGVMIVKTKKVK